MRFMYQQVEKTVREVTSRMNGNILIVREVMDYSINHPYDETDETFWFSTPGKE